MLSENIKDLDDEDADDLVLILVLMEDALGV